MSEATKQVKVGSTEDLRLALAAGYDADQIVIDVSEAISAARAEGFDDGAASVDVEAAVSAERSRILKIQSLTRRGLESIATVAVETGITVEAFALQQAEEIADRGITMDQIERGSPPHVEHSPTKTSGAGDSLVATAILLGLAKE